ncbi:uncharacterized protein LOC110022562 isoform X2 [Phalaenopsis equestris]|uniref:uncharacterized protein LOC110022562 isoform X2 n=1 Tax=Phalaenopsis equestris TaxID=78828 RepID=UPI0009E35919|nr:uncharacterized protein LOC110022562 isoform X2 [Phalaenopsis equestris]
MMAMENCLLAFGVGDHLFQPFSLDVESPMSSEAATGYLQDAVVEWRERCKRRRMVLPFCFDPPMAAVVPTTAEDIHEILQMFWGSDCAGNTYGELDSLFQESSTVSGNNFSFWAEAKERTGAKIQKETLFSPPSSSSQEICSTILAVKKKKEENGDRTMKRRKKKVAYPFAVLKPAGLEEGEVTLAEINRRIMMRPMRPVRHPVGEYKCLPCVADVGGGPGLSGKAVVGLTRIHTRGKGSITIVRTRG